MEDEAGYRWEERIPVSMMMMTMMMMMMMMMIGLDRCTTTFSNPNRSGSSTQWTCSRMATVVVDGGGVGKNE